MASRSRDVFTTIHSEGALLPADLLQRIADGGSGLEGLTPADYHLSGERITEATSRAWNRLQGAWSAFKLAREKLPDSDPGTSVTRERWLLPLFNTLDYGRLETARAVEIDGKSYPISHRWRDVPIHLLGCNIKLDERQRGVAGAATATPHGLLQVYLNRSDEMLWGIVSNGLRLRILRDNASLTRQAYVDFDLEAMMEGEVYADFVLLYLLCHQSRVEADKLSDFWLEKWMNAAQQQGTRALDQLRDGVQNAIEFLGSGFISHPANHSLIDKLQSGELKTQDYYRQLLRLVYRLLFLFTAEDRELLHPDGVDETAKQAYHDCYSTRHLRDLAGKIKGSRHPDLFDGLRVVMRLLSGEEFYNDDQRTLLGLPALNGWLLREEALPDVMACQIANHDLLDAVHALALTDDRIARVSRAVDYKNLGPEELGSVYESLLELHPEIHIEARQFALSSAAGHERKTTGSYYTPDSLVQALLDSALDPVIDEARKSPDPEAALLDLKICDPACGSGHFLIAAARRVAKKLAAVRTQEDEPAPRYLRHALRDVIGRCIYGVDINPMAVELCKVNLWIEALEPGKPLSFLDHRIQCGNSLLGTTPALIAQGIPDEAFNPIEGDDKEVAAYFKKKNRTERRDLEDPDRGAQLALFETQPFATHSRLASQVARITRIPDDTIDGVRAQEAAYQQIEQSREKVRERFLADLWCAIFVWEKDNRPREDYHLPPPTALLYERLYRAEDPWSIDVAVEKIAEETARLADQYQFFHWHVAFPDVFDVPERIEDSKNTQTGWSGGFDCVLGNPPWERIKIQEKEWFAERNPGIAASTNTATRKMLIDELIENNPSLLADFQQDRRTAEGESHVVLRSGRYPLCGRGDVNTYTIFAETNSYIVDPGGYVGVIVPSGIASDDTTKFFFQSLIDNQTIASLYSFENEEFIFPGIHHSTKFCLLTLSGIGHQSLEPDFLFFARQVSYLDDQFRHFTLTSNEIALINPNTRTSPTFRTRRDAELTKAIHRLVPVLMREEPEENPWQIAFFSMFHMSNDSHLFHTFEQLVTAGYILDGNRFVRDREVYLPLFEGKMVDAYNHRFSSSVINQNASSRLTIQEEHLDDNWRDPSFYNLPLYWIQEKELASTANQLREFQKVNIVYKRVTQATSERTLKACLLANYAVGDKLPLVLTESISDSAILLANFNSFVLDFIARQKTGYVNLAQFVLMQLPVIPPHTCTSMLSSFLMPRVVELSYTAWDLQPFAQDTGYDGPPFIWDADRRFLLRCELDALYFHLYQIAREDVDYIMETFPIVKRKDEAAYGEYRTKRVILQMYDQMAALPQISVPHPKGLDEEYLVPDVSQFKTWLKPPPADPSVAHKDQD